MPCTITRAFYEVQRWYPVVGWTKKLLPTDPDKFCDENAETHLGKDAVAPESCTWDGEWTVVTKDGKTDKDGWDYAMSWGWEFQAKQAKTDVFRKRRYERPCKSELSEEELLKKLSIWFTVTSPLFYGIPVVLEWTYRDAKKDDAVFAFDGDRRVARVFADVGKKEMTLPAFLPSGPGKPDIDLKLKYLKDEGTLTTGDVLHEQAGFVLKHPVKGFSIDVKDGKVVASIDWVHKIQSAKVQFLYEGEKYHMKALMKGAVDSEASAPLPRLAGEVQAKLLLGDSDAVLAESTPVTVPNTRLTVGFHPKLTCGPYSNIDDVKVGGASVLRATVDGVLTKDDVIFVGPEADPRKGKSYPIKDMLAQFEVQDLKTPPRAEPTEENPNPPSPRAPDDVVLHVAVGLLQPETQPKVYLLPKARAKVTVSVAATTMRPHTDGVVRAADREAEAEELDDNWFFSANYDPITKKVEISPDFDKGDIRGGFVRVVNGSNNYIAKFPLRADTKTIVFSPPRVDWLRVLLYEAKNPDPVEECNLPLPLTAKNSGHSVMLACGRQSGIDIEAPEGGKVDIFVCGQIQSDDYLVVGKEVQEVVQGLLLPKEDGVSKVAISKDGHATIDAPAAGNSTQVALAFKHADADFADILVASACVKGVKK
eukprot:TRINITY_DN3496_c0_g1_i1.p1 TRINITY_DN3496_c0_g1~~TRINITY_DN3496_c0_g1_i1.p1  ORF type:complete len:650 (+),score=253.20 TRINITY_DN3496_c0_g1_i1:52-2001(+)